MTEAEIRQELQKLHEDHTRFKQTKGRYPLKEELLPWLQEQGVDVDARYLPFCVVRWYALRNVRMYGTFYNAKRQSHYENISDPVRPAW